MSQSRQPRKYTHTPYTHTHLHEPIKAAHTRHTHTRTCMSQSRQPHSTSMPFMCANRPTKPTMSVTCQICTRRLHVSYMPEMWYLLVRQSADEGNDGHVFVLLRQLHVSYIGYMSCVCVCYMCSCGSYMSVTWVTCHVCVCVLHVLLRPMHACKRLHFDASSIARAISC